MQNYKKLTPSQYEELGRLTQRMLHNFNNSLASIVGFSEFLIHDLPPGSQAHLFAKNIHQSGEQMKQLIKQIRTIAAPNQDLTIEKIDLCEFLETLLLSLSEDLPKKYHIDVDYSCDLDTAYIQSDSSELSIALSNILDNAIDTLKESGGQILVSLEKNLSSKEKTQYRIAIKDNGAGMTPEIKEQCETPFFSTGDAAEHSGLGLNIAHTIITTLSGEILISSEPKQGTTVSITLPENL